MGFSLLPAVQAASLADLTPEVLAGLGITALLLDFDNTIVPYSTSVPSVATTAWFTALKEAGIAVCIVSNSRRDRVLDFCNALELPCIRRAAKPSTRGLRQGMALLGAEAAHTAMVGDQIYTDVLAGNLAGVRAILVQPIALSNFLLRARHWLELPFIIATRAKRLP